MKAFFNELIKLVIIAGIVCIAVIKFDSCHRVPDQEVIGTKTEIRVDSFWQQQIVYKDRHFYHHDTVKTLVPANVDSSTAVTDYYTFKSVNDSFIGKNYRILLDDTLYMNSLWARRATIFVLQVDSVITHTNTISSKPKMKFYLGLSVSSNNAFDHQHIYFNAALQNKKEGVWVIGADPFNKQGQLTYLKKIKLK